jgi:tRNA A37 threonylcarbamoyladenosine dehydratase
MKNNIFQRSEAILGTETMQSMADAKVILFGTGGVGSWCAEALVRSGVHRLVMVDFDRVAESNINRQLPAASDTLGRLKVEVMRERLATINPEAEITAIAEAYTEESSERFHLEKYDYIIDAIDSLPDKAHLIRTAATLNGTLFSSMGAALRLDNTRIRTAEFRKVHGCPLAAALRRRLKQTGGIPDRPFTCVFSDEPAMSCKERGSLVHVTAAFGLTLAGLVVRDIYSSHINNNK